MPADYHHGVRVVEISEGVRPIRVINTAIIGIVCTAPDADAAYFPLDTPVLITSVLTALGKAGTAGTLAKTLDAIADQGAPVIVAVRVAPGLDEAATNAAVIGTVTAGGQYTGMQALLAAESKIGVRPRILACATHAQPAQRYATAAALQNDLERLLAHRPVAARRPTPWH